MASTALAVRWQFVHLIHAEHRIQTYAMEEFIAYAMHALCPPTRKMLHVGGPTPEPLGITLLLPSARQLVPAQQLPLALLGLVLPAGSLLVDVRQFSLQRLQLVIRLLDDS